MEILKVYQLKVQNNYSSMTTLAVNKGFNETLTTPQNHKDSTPVNLRSFDAHFKTLNTGIISVAKNIGAMHNNVTELISATKALTDLRTRVDNMEKTLIGHGKTLADVMNNVKDLDTLVRAQAPMLEALYTKVSGLAMNSNTTNTTNAANTLNTTNTNDTLNTTNTNDLEPLEMPEPVLELPEPVLEMPEPTLDTSESVEHSKPVKLKKFIDTDNLKSTLEDQDQDESVNTSQPVTPDAPKPSSAKKTVKSATSKQFLLSKPVVNELSSVNQQESELNNNVVSVASIQQSDSDDSSVEDENKVNASTTIADDDDIEIVDSEEEKPKPKVIVKKSNKVVKKKPAPAKRGQKRN